MPNPSLNSYTNKKSIKVNAGLPWTNCVNNRNAFNKLDIIMHTAFPIINTGTGELSPQTFRLEPALSTEELIRRLLSPPKHAFLYNTLSIYWVMAAAGSHNFEFREDIARYVLAADPEIRRKGSEFGLPVLYMEWLCGDDDELSATEQAIYLTPDFFEGLL